MSFLLWKTENPSFFLLCSLNAFRHPFMSHLQADASLPTPNFQSFFKKMIHIHTQFLDYELLFYILSAGVAWAFFSLNRFSCLRIDVGHSFLPARCNVTAQGCMLGFLGCLYPSCRTIYADVDKRHSMDSSHMIQTFLCNSYSSGCHVLLYIWGLAYTWWGITIESQHSLPLCSLLSFHSA